MIIRRSLAALALVACLSLIALEACGDEASGAVAPLTPAQKAVVDYAYHVFPHELAAAERGAALAEYEAALWQQRAKSYEPMRSFGAYGATYLANQTAQLEAFAAQQRAECARHHVTNLWRFRQRTVAILMQQAEQVR